MAKLVQVATILALLLPLSVRAQGGPKRPATVANGAQMAAPEGERAAAPDASDSAVSSVRRVTDEAMARVARGELESAFEILGRHSIISKDGVSAGMRQAVEQQTSALFRDRFGVPRGYDFVDAERRGQNVMRLRYVQLNSKHGIPWTFYFYRMQSGWVLVKYDWSVRVEDLFP